jgi:glycosyltransferase involved in cell wall biosynthesis
MNKKTEILLKRMDGKRIKYLGIIPEDKYFETIAEADVLCVTRTDSEFAGAGFPFKLGEYLAAGKPVIATDVGDITKYLKDREDVILARPSDVDSLLHAMEFSILHKKLSAEIGLRGRDKALKYFHPRTNGKALLNFIEIISDKK